VLQPKGVQMLQGHLSIKVHPPAVALASWAVSTQDNLGWKLCTRMLKTSVCDTKLKKLQG
jgi:hypothetical protein